MLAVVSAAICGSVKAIVWSLDSEATCSVVRLATWAVVKALI